MTFETAHTGRNGSGISVEVSPTLDTAGGPAVVQEVPQSAGALLSDSGGVSDNEAQAGQLVPVAFIESRSGGEISSGEVASSLKASDGKNPGRGFGGVVQPLSFAENQKDDLYTSETASTLTASGGGKPGRGFAAVLTPEYAVRKFTPRECERLQGFPDDWTATDRDGRRILPARRLKMLGNAVCVPVAQWIGEGLARG